MNKTQTQVICRNVFKNGESKTTKKQYTRQWIELINQLEKSKRTLVSVSGEAAL